MKLMAVGLLALSLLIQSLGPPQRPKIVGVAHVAFRVSTMASPQRFYGGVLGLQGVATHPAANARARFRVNDRQDILLEGGLPANDEERLSHLAFETTDLDRLAAWLKAQGVTIEDAPPPPARPCAARALWVKDPDGHPIEFVQRDEAPAGTRGGDGRGDGGRNGRAARAAVREGDQRDRAARLPGAGPISARVLHAGLTIRDVEAADRFYKTVLGFAEIWRGGRTDDVTSWINMKVPDGTDYLEYMLVTGPVSRQQRGSLHHVALLVPDIQTAYETAIHRTAPDARDALASPQVGRNRRWQLNLFDPDGSRVELMEPFTMR